MVEFVLWKEILLMKDLENQKILLLMSKNNAFECMDCKFYYENIF